MYLFIYIYYAYFTHTGRVRTLYIAQHEKFLFWIESTDQLSRILINHLSFSEPVPYSTLLTLSHTHTCRYGHPHTPGFG